MQQHGRGLADQVHAEMIEGKLGEPLRGDIACLGVEDPQSCPMTLIPFPKFGRRPGLENEAAIGEDESGGGGPRHRQGAQAVGRDHVVLEHELDPVGRRLGETPIAIGNPSHPEVRGVLEQPESRIAPDIGLDELDRPVRRAVVDHQNLEIGQSLGGDAVEALPDVSGPVEYGDTN